jgi:hypothetical protein
VAAREQFGPRVAQIAAVALLIRLLLAELSGGSFFNCR